MQHQQPVNRRLATLRQKLCKSKTDFCQECFTRSSFWQCQNPPNVFRDHDAEVNSEFFFVFDKPNDNDPFRASNLIPITILDNRSEFSNPTRRNLITLFDILGIQRCSDGIDPLCSKQVHITNAVKCDKCAATGQTGQIKIGSHQVQACLNRFFYEELSILQPRVILFFGKNPDDYVTGRSGKLWAFRQEVINGKTYDVVRVPHTTSRPFNTHGKGGQAYQVKLKNLFSS